MAKKASGPDGLSAQMLRALEPDQVALVAQAFRTWEATGQMPETVTMTLVALLPKKATEERPIGLTSYAYRAWCRARYHLHEDWARQYKQHSPWDRAIKGRAYFFTPFFFFAPFFFFCPLGPLVLWSPGPLVPWSSGPVVLWSRRPLVFWVPWSGAAPWSPYPPPTPPCQPASPSTPTTTTSLQPHRPCL